MEGLLFVLGLVVFFLILAFIREVCKRWNAFDPHKQQLANIRSELRSANATIQKLGQTINGQHKAFEKIEATNQRLNRDLYELIEANNALKVLLESDTHDYQDFEI